MAQEQVGVEALFSINVDGLKAGIRAAQREFTGLTGAVAGMDKRLSMAATALNESKSAHASLAQAGIQTTASVQAQIAAWEQLEKAVQGDVVATAQIIQRKKALQQVMEASSAATQKAGASTHRANLFMINFSRGVEDLKFGLPAVINNLEGIALGYQMMAKEAEEAGRTTKQAIIGTLTSPAGMLAVMNLAITTAYIFGGAIKKAFSEAGASAKQLGEAARGLLGDLSVEGQFEAKIPKNSAEVRRLANEFRNYADEVRASAIEQGKFTEKWISAGGQAVKVRELTSGVADEFRNVREVSKGVREELEKYADKLEATAIASEKMAKKLQNARSLASQSKKADMGIYMPGSLGFLEQQISNFEEAMRRVPIAMRSSMAPTLEELRRQLRIATFEHVPLIEATEKYNVVLDDIALDIPAYADSVDFLNTKLKHLTEKFNETGDAATRSGLAKQINATREQIEEMTKAISKQKQEAVYQTGSWGALDKQLETYDEQLKAATTSTERLSIAMKMSAADAGRRFERMLMDVNDELSDFKYNAILGLGDAATGGLFGGLFREFKKADAIDARMAIADLNAEFGDLEERLASGEISYAQFAAANAQRMRDLAAANKELSLAMRSDFELALARVGNAFQGLADMAKKAFQQIAQDYTRLLVQRGLLRIIGMFINPASAALPIASDAGGNVLGSLGGNFAARVSIAPQAAVVPSGDLQISLRRAGAISSRTGV